jgi:hypothetical protein
MRKSVIILRFWEKKKQKCLKLKVQKNKTHIENNHQILTQEQEKKSYIEYKVTEKSYLNNNK